MWKGEYHYLPVVEERQEASVEWWQDSFKPWGGNVVYSQVKIPSAVYWSTQSPLEQISVTHDKTDYLWYFTSISSSNGNFAIDVTNANDFVAIFVDDQLIGKPLFVCILIQSKQAEREEHLEV